MPFLFLGFGVLSVIVLLVADRIGQRSAVVDLELLQAVSEIRLDTATSHLWLEEYVSGDIVDVLDVYESLDRARMRVRGLLGEGSGLVGAGFSTDGLSKDGRSTGDLSTDGALESRAKSLAENIEEFRRISFERQQGYEEGLEVGIGSALDQRYDEVFQQAQGDAATLQAALESRMALRRRRGDLVLTWILLGWALLVAAATLGLWNHERRRRLAEQALRTSQEQLLQSQKLDASGRLASGLAHDLNNYLAAVRGHCELVELRRSDDAWVVEKMTAAMRGVERSSSLIDQLMTFGRFRPEQTASVDLNEIVRGLESVVAPSLGERASLQLSLAEDLGAVWVDAGQIEQVLVNLVLNAQDAIEGEGVVRVSTENRSTGGGEVKEVVLEVADNGIGVAEEIQDRLFEPFVSTRAGDGRRGLGLAMVHRIVGEAGGHVDFESRPGEGTTFRGVLPRHVVQTSGEVPEAVISGSSLIP